MLRNSPLYHAVNRLSVDDLRELCKMANKLSPELFWEVDSIPWRNQLCLLVYRKAEMYSAVGLAKKNDHVPNDPPIGILVPLTRGEDAFMKKIRDFLHAVQSDRRAVPLIKALRRMHESGL